METLIFPTIFGTKIKAFFTGKNPGADLPRIAEIASIGMQEIFVPVQKHTDEILLLNSFEPQIGDAVITDKKGVLIGVQVADCVPILLYDRRTGAMGAVHAGWRGTAAGILKKTIYAMMRRFAAVQTDIVLAIGPGIRWCCYDVGLEVIDAVKTATGAGDYCRVERGKRYLDLPRANMHQAISAGVNPDNICMSVDCTCCMPEKYFSYRFAKGSTGRQGAFIGFVQQELFTPGSGANVCMQGQSQLRNLLHDS